MNGKKRSKAQEERWTATDAADFAFQRFDEEVRVDSVVQEMTLGASTPVSPAGSSEALKVRASIARFVDVHAGLFSRAIYTLAAELTGSVTTQPTDSGGPEPIILVGEPGARIGAVLWIHNVSDAFVPELKLRLTSLWHPNGSRLSGALGTIDPSRMEASVERRRSAWVSCTIPHEAARGTYYGHILAIGVDGAAVQVRLIVR